MTCEVVVEPADRERPEALRLIGQHHYPATLQLAADAADVAPVIVVAWNGYGGKAGLQLGQGSDRFLVL